MAEFGTYGDVHVELHDDHVAVLEIRRPPDNFFDRALIARSPTRSRRSTRSRAAEQPCCAPRASTSAPAQTSAARRSRPTTAAISTTKPCACFAPRSRRRRRAGCRHRRRPRPRALRRLRSPAPEARFSANFARLSFHHGFGLTVTLPGAVGQQRALELLYTGRALDGEEALRIGLCDRLAPLDASRRRPRTRRRHRRLRPASHGIDPPDDARRPRGAHRQGHRPRARRARAPAAHVGLPRRCRGDGCAQKAQLRTPLNGPGASREACQRGGCRLRGEPVRSSSSP